MILEDLHRFYLSRDVASPLDPTPGPDLLCPAFWTVKPVCWRVSYDRSGGVLGCAPAGDGGRGAPRLLPDVSRTSGVVPFVFADNAAYVLGDDARRGEEKHEAFRRIHHAVLDGIEEPGVMAFLKLIDRDPDDLEVDQATRDAMRQGMGGGLIAFHYDDDPDWMEIQNEPAAAEAWERYARRKEEACEDVGTCLVTGKRAPLAELFPQVTGISGANTAGASLVSFNQPAFCSYGQKRASISTDAARRCGEALRFLFKSPSHNTLVGKDHVIFWTEGGTREGLGILSLALNADDLIASAKKREDTDQLNLIMRNLERIRRGLPIREVDETDRYHVIGIAPYQARLAIRFHEEGTLGELERHLREFLQDTEMVGVEPRSMKGYLMETAPLVKRENIPSPLITASMRALLRGTPFPSSLYCQLLSRMRADHASRNTWDMGLRAAILKGILVRRARMTGEGPQGGEGSLKMALNEDNDHIAYLLGRLFAVLEKVQADAIGSETKATIRDRYMSSASTTPARVFPQLLKLAQHHVSKATYGSLYDRKIQDIVSRMPDEGSFPRTLSYDEQGEFYIGYYQQRQDLYTKKDKGSAAGQAIANDSESNAVHA
jgi:CRISPR-associated protein Csd1